MDTLRNTILQYTELPNLAAARNCTAYQVLQTHRHHESHIMQNSTSNSSVNVDRHSVLLINLTSFWYQLVV
jgi:hypothetical protein